jgi:hypothetical protein
MRGSIAIFLAALATLAVPAAPALARTSDLPNSNDKPAAPACNGYEQRPDGSWKQMPCQELNSGAAADPKSPTRSAGKTGH